MPSKPRISLLYPRPTDDSPVRLTPLSVLYPAEMFRAKGYETHIWDERFDSEAELDSLLRASDEVGVSAFTGYQCGRAARLLKRAKAIKPGIITHVGGHHARLLPEQVKAEPFVDNVWPGQQYGEEHFPFRPETAKHFARTDMQYYTSRGCPFPCTFCALTSPWSPKPIEELDRELKTIHAHTGFREVSFSDPNAAFGVWRDSDGKRQTMDRVKRIRDIGKIMRDIGATWDGNIRSPYFSPEMVEALQYSNCTSIEIGCESGDDWFLKRVIKKGHGVDSIKNAARVIRGSGISIMYSFIMFMPRETHEQRMRTADLIDWIRDVDPLARVSIYKFSPYPGSPMFDDAVAGVDGYPKFNPPQTMEEWGALKLMVSPIYWVAGLTMRLDNSRKNFAGADWQLIEPYIKLAQQKWKDRDFEDFPCEEVEALIAGQVAKNNRAAAQLYAAQAV